MHSKDSGKRYWCLGLMPVIETWIAFCDSGCGKLSEPLEKPLAWEAAREHKKKTGHQIGVEFYKKEEKEPQGLEGFF